MNTQQIITIIVISLLSSMLTAILMRSHQSENISDQEYKNASLQYMEDIRNAVDYLASEV